MEIISFRYFILLCWPLIVCGNVGIPVLLFKDKRVDTSIPKPIAGHTIASKDFTDLLKLFNKPDLLITFIQDELSNEDFLRLDDQMKSGGLFRNVQEYSSQATSLYFPSIKAPTHSFKSIAQHYDEMLDLHNADEVVQYLNKVSLQKGTSVTIHLLHTSDEQTSSMAMKRNDEIIGQVMSIIEKSGLRYVAAFTANKHRDAAESSAAHRVGRHLLESADESANDNATNFYNNTHCMIYAETIKINEDILPAKTAITCNTDGAQTTITIGANLIMLYSLDNSTGFWSLNKTTVATNYVVSAEEVSAPLLFSYHCNEGLRFFDSSNKSLLRLEIKRLQVQVSGFDTVGKFGSAYDCTGFFTIPLWTGLLITLFLIAVSIYGLSMLSAIQTFDQYDDPKSKPLTVNISE